MGANSTLLRFLWMPKPPLLVGPKAASPSAKFDPPLIGNQNDGLLSLPIIMVLFRLTDISVTVTGKTLNVCSNRLISIIIWCLDDDAMVL